jgi:hypothetical protein
VALTRVFLPYLTNEVIRMPSGKAAVARAGTWRTVTLHSLIATEKALDTTRNILALITSRRGVTNSKIVEPLEAGGLGPRVPCEVEAVCRRFV